MRARLAGLIAAAALLGALPAMAEPRQVWETTGLKGPESVIYDPAGELIYVSNVNGEPGVKDGDGFISKLDSAGRIDTLEWVKGLDAPTGMALADGALYVADIDRLVTIDMATGEIVARHKAAGARSLGGVSADPQARIFVADTATNRIWTLEGEQFALWLDDPALMGPSSILAESTRLLVASRGSTAGGSREKVPGRVLTVDLASKAIADFGRAAPLGNPEGLVSDGGEGYLTADSRTGALFHLAADGTAAKVLTLTPGIADLGIIPEQKVVLIPLAGQDRVVAYRLD